MTVPLIARIGVLVVATTAFYTYVGQMVPQKEVQPPQETVLAANLTTADMVTVGKQIMEGKGLCTTCHTIGKTGAPLRDRVPPVARRHAVGDAADDSSLSHHARAGREADSGGAAEGDDAEARGIP